MAMIKRIFLFLVVNILVMVTISTLLSILGVQPYLTQNGIDYNSLMVFCLVWGFGGALISLLLSRVMAKWMMGVQIIDENVSDPDLRAYVATVYRLADTIGLPKRPEVGIYESPELNAFATGPTKSRALVAVSSGLLQRSTRPQLEGIIGHEIAHIANGDMVTMTLIQGVVNAFVMFFARVIAFAISQNSREENRRAIQFVTTMVLEIALSILGAMVVSYFSRLREFRADRGGADLAGREKMIDALRALKKNYEIQAGDQPAAIATLKVSGKSGGLMALLATHPPLDVRIERLQQGY